MNNEETILDEQFVNNSSKKETKSEAQPTEAQEKKNNSGEKWVYGAAGVVIGAGATMAGQAVAATSSEQPEIEVKPEDDAAVSADANAATTPKPEDSPNPEDVIIATDDGIRVAQVNDDLSFGQAFAEARAQVGAGGVFEWHGKVYSTYYKDEWNAMSADERAEYQASIDYEDVTGTATAVTHDDVTVHHVHHVHHEHTYVHDEVNKPESQSAVEQQDEVEVSVINAGETDLNGDGVPEYSVLLDCNGQKVLIVDIDMDGYAEGAISDLNGDGQLSEGEIADISKQHIAMPGMESDNYMTSDDDMPGYTDNADTGFYTV